MSIFLAEQHILNKLETGPKTVKEMLSREFPRRTLYTARSRLVSKKAIAFKLNLRDTRQKIYYLINS